jgi:hypothetical protein
LAKFPDLCGSEGKGRVGEEESGARDVSKYSSEASVLVSLGGRRTGSWCAWSPRGNPWLVVAKCPQQVSLLRGGHGVSLALQLLLW